MAKKTKLPHEVLESSRKQEAKGGKTGGKRCGEATTPEERTACTKKASAAGVAVRKSKRQDAKPDQDAATRRFGELLLVAEFSGPIDSWTLELRLKLRPDGTITLSSVGNEVLASGREGKRLVPYDDDAVITLSPGETSDALSWLSGQGWDEKPGFEDARRQIMAALGA